MTVPMERDFDPGDDFPSVVMDALQRMVTAGLGAIPIPIRVKPGASNTLQVPAGTGDDAAGLIIDGHWRWNEAATEQAGSGSAGQRDIWTCATASVYTAGSPGETDETDRSFVLRVTAVDAAAPGGFAHTRKVARAEWDGAAWLSVAAIVGATVLEGLAPHAGDLKATARSTAPPGWLLCDGAAVSRSTYAPLFAAIGIAYGAGNGSTTFNLPDLRGRVPVGVDGAAARLDALDALGNAGGAQKHTLVTAEMPAHHHRFRSGLGTGSSAAAFDFSQTYNTSAYADVIGPNQAIEDTGGSGAHNNMQPYAVVNWVIKL